jgi:hypothetical protein
MAGASNDDFGLCAISGTTAVVGSKFNGGTGAAYVYVLP